MPAKEIAHLLRKLVQGRRHDEPQAPASLMVQLSQPFHCPDNQIEAQQRVAALELDGQHIHRAFPDAVASGIERCRCHGKSQVGLGAADLAVLAGVATLKGRDDDMQRGTGSDGFSPRCPAGGKKPLLPCVTPVVWNKKPCCHLGPANGGELGRIVEQGVQFVGVKEEVVTRRRDTNQRSVTERFYVKR